MDHGTLLTLLVIAVFCMAIGGFLGSAKNRGGLGLLLGLFLGPLGVVIIAAIPPRPFS